MGTILVKWSDGVMKRRSRLVFVVIPTMLAVIGG